MKYITFLLCFCVLTLAGCGGSEHEELRDWMKEQASGMKGNVKAPPPLISPAIVSYSANEKLSPFSAEKAITSKSRPGVESDRVSEYLESFSLESLKVIGIIIYNNKKFALIQTPEKPKHVTIGNYIGLNAGTIVAITDNEVKIVEMVKNANDVWVKREKSLYLIAEGAK